MGGSDPQLDRPALLCLPHAGSSIAAFRSWVDVLAPRWLVVPLELPGRGARFREPLVSDMGAALDSLLPQVAAHASRPWALFGHSLGALLAFELAHRLRDTAPPHVLVTSGRNGPGESSEAPPAHDLPDGELLATLRRYGGMPAEGDPLDSLLEVFLPILRADLRLAETYAPPRRPKLDCPVVSLVGRGDPLTSRARVAAWGQATRRSFRVVEHDGDHFSVYEPAFGTWLGDLLATAATDAVAPGLRAW